MKMQSSKALANMSALILKPLIEVLIRNDFSHSELTELVRQSYVDVAYEEFSEADQRMTYSRVASLTGLCRKEVVRLKNKCSSSEILDSQYSIESMRVVNGWMCDEDYIDNQNTPIELTVNGGNNSFECLVNKYSHEIPYEVMLNQLNKAGITSQFNHGKVRLKRTDYVLQQQEMEKVRVMSVCASDLFSTAIANDQTSGADIRFHSQLVYSGIEEKLAKQFHDIGSDKAMAFFKTLTEFLSTDRQESDPELTGNGKRVGLGIYYFEGAKQIKSVKMTSEEHA